MKKIAKMPFFKLFTPKPKSKMPLWASLVGLSLSAAVFGITRGKRRDVALPFQNAIKNFTQKTSLPNLNVMDNTALTEFSEELMENALKNKQ